ncbi:8171_t:CDS:2 [Ambispora leptoticha]|uniref:8171_t:CDS:1 n=1 Tax=Ambispora leptoticha TaxID=144679 RepID=A0A9N9F1B8_9GLOM|nr:8171_t:CDS:2 [Ambispora leptoticha]
MSNLPFRQILSDEETRDLETVDVYVADIEPKETENVLKFIKKNLPSLFLNLNHVKRVRKIYNDEKDKGKGFTLTILFCLTTVISLADLQALLASNEFDKLIPRLRVVKVSKYPPITRAQFDAWKQLWPLNFREPKKAIELAQLAKSKGEIPIGCVVVDPRTNTILAECHDTRASTRHPLCHSVLNCINAVANSEISSRQPKNANEEPMCSMALVHSRIGRVFYAKENPNSGGLGSTYKIHTHSSLNHHFQVFVWDNIVDARIETLNQIDT